MSLFFLSSVRCWAGYRKNIASLRSGAYMMEQLGKTRLATKNRDVVRLCFNGYSAVDDYDVRIEEYSAHVAAPHPPTFNPPGYYRL